MAEYNGYRSWNAWNCCLWLDNDYYTYQFLADRLKRYKQAHYDKETASICLACLLNMLLGAKTKDGAVFNRLTLKNYIKDFVDEHWEHI